MTPNIFKKKKKGNWESTSSFQKEIQKVSRNGYYSEAVIQWKIPEKYVELNVKTKN